MKEELIESGGKLEKESKFCAWITNEAVLLSVKTEIQGEEMVEKKLNSVSHVLSEVYQ